MAQSIGQYEHLRFGEADRPLNGLWRVPAQTGTGTARTGVVNIHGWAARFLGGNSYVDPLVSTLQKQGVGVLLAERRGTNVLGFFGPEMRGASTQPLEQEVADTRLAVEAAREHGNLERVVLVGFSIGATIAAACAAEADSGIDGVVLISPTLMPQWMGRVDDRHEALLAAANKAVHEGDPDRIIVDRHQAYGMPVAAGAYRSLSNAHLASHLAVLRERRTPVLVIAGSEDPAMHISYGQGPRDFMHQVVPDAKVLEIAGAGHDFANEHAALLAKKVQGFVGGLALR